MPYRKPYPSRRKYRKRQYKRKRFSKKRFSKSNYAKTVVKVPVNARDTYVKFPWLRTFSPVIAAASATTYAFLGNSLIPTPASYSSNTPTAGDIWCSGVSEYSAFYNNYRVLGSSIKIQLTAVSANNVFRAVLLPIMCGGAESGAPGTIATRIAELDALTYDQLAQQPFAQSKTIGLATGGNSARWFKLFRKSKYMLGIKDIRDKENTLLNLPDPLGSNGEITTQADDSWFFYLRIFNSAAATSQQLEVQVRLKYYTQLTGRTNWVPIAVPA